MRIPILVEGEGQRSDATFHYSIGSFSGRETPLPLRAGLTTILRFRIPLELFRPREHLIVKVLARAPAGEERVLWAKRWGPPGMARPRRCSRWLTRREGPISPVSGTSARLGVHSVSMSPDTAPHGPGAELPGNAESPAHSGLLSNEPCWGRTSDHRIKRAHFGYFVLPPLSGFVRNRRKDA